MNASAKAVLLFLLVPCVLANQQQQQQQDASKYVNDWLTAGRILSQYAWPHRQPFVNLVNFLLDQENTSTTPRVSTQCTKSLSSFVSALAKQREDAMFLFDSFAKASPGLLSDRLQDFGHYTQCHKSSFEGQATAYFLLALHWPMPNGTSSHFTLTFDEKIFEKVTKQRFNSSWLAKFNRNVDNFSIYPQLLAICLPVSCSDDDVTHLLRHLNSHISPLEFSVFSSESMVIDPFTDYNGSFLQIASRSLLCLLVTFSLLSTVLCNLRPQVFKDTFFNHFDALAHTDRLFSFSPASKQRPTEFISGYKGLYLITAISNHAYMPLTPAIGFHYLPIHTLEVFDPLWNTFQRAMATFNVNVSVSAMLNAISWIEPLEKSRGKTTLALFLMLRILRTLPVTLVCLLLVYSFPVLPPGSGPLVTRAQQSILSNCLKNGWKELLFISNFQNIQHICYPVGWYLSADLQLYALSYISLLALAMKPRLGYLLIFAKVVIGVVSEALIIYSNDIHPALPMMNIPSIEKMFAVLAFTHSYTHNYLACYSIGILGGYFIVKSTRFRMTFPTMMKTIVIILIALTPTILALWSYDGCKFKLNNRTYEILLASIFRTSQSVAFCLFSVILSQVPSSFVSKLLSNPVLIMSSRMSFSMFMIHPVIMALIFSSRMDTDYTRSYYTMLILFVFALSFLLGYVIVVCVEYPFNSLLRSALKPKAATKVSTFTDKETSSVKKQS